MKKILPFGNSPIICYPDYASLFGIVDAYTSNYREWIYNYFIQLVVYDNFDMGFRVDFVPPKILKSIPWLNIDKINRKIINDTWESFVSFVKVAIDNNMYIFSLLDANYTYLKSGDKNRPFLHEHLIFGYDDEKKIFYFGDNCKYGKYVLGEILYSDIEKANQSVLQNNLVDWHNGVMMISFNNVYDYGNYVISNKHQHVFDVGIVKELACDYLLQHDSERKWVPPTVLKNRLISCKKCWGIGVYDYAIRYINYIGEKEGKLEIRGFYVLYEHKKIMKDILNYLLEKFAVKDEYYPKYCDLSIKRASSLVSLCIKYNLNHKKELLNSIENGLVFLAENDKRIMQYIIRLTDKCDREKEK